MKQFIKFVFASCLGVFLALGVLFFLMFLVGVAFSGSDKEIQKGSILLLEFKGKIPEKTDNVDNGQFNFNTEKSIGVHRISDLLKKAQSDSNIEGIVYKAPVSGGGGMVTNSIIRDAIKEFRDSTDKFVYSYADFYSNPTYLLASASDSIFINPNGSVDINGYAAVIPFFKEGLDKLGVKMNVFYAGNFKSATEPYRRANMSPQNKLQTREYLNDYYNGFLDDITEQRNIDRSAVTDVINAFDVNNIDACISNGIVDAQVYWYELEDMLRGKLNVGDGKDINYVSLQEYDLKTFISKGISGNKIAVVYAEGNIEFDNEKNGNISEGTYHKIFDKIRSQDNVKAVVLRVNSPGGSAYTSDAIWREMKELQSDGIPVVASFGDYAASGGYYIAARADKIVAHPNTLTGSIGVFSMLPNMTELLNDKLGIEFDTVKTSPHAASLSTVLDMDEAQKVGLQRSTDQLYQKFLGRVAEGRGMTVDEVHEVAQGRVWTGQKAKELGLVDELGGLDKALEIASDLANVSDDYKVVEYPAIELDFWEEILSEAMKNQAHVIPQISNEEKAFLNKYKDLRTMLRYQEPIARMPFNIIMN